MEDEAPHVQVKFFTKQKQYSVPDTPFSVPADVDSKQLSRETEGSGDDSDQQVEFDFLLDGVFLRSSLGNILEEKDISFETVVELEYVERQPAPRPENSLVHDDWVSALQAAGQNILSGSYDNTIRLWSTEGEPLMTIPGHTAPVKCVAWIHQGEGEETSTFVTGSHDQTALLWRWHGDSNEVDCVHACRGHAGSVDCVAVGPTREKMCTGSWDKMLKLWSADCSTEEEQTDDTDRPNKKKKSSGFKTQTRVPILTLSGHSEAVSAVHWMDEKTVVTSSWDHTLRLWDLQQAVQSSLMQGSKVFLDISYSTLNGLIVAASADRHVRLYDPRSKDGAVVKCSFTSHTGWVVGVDWSPTREHLFISGSYDTVLKLWDSRSPKAPLYNMSGHEDKILAVDWSAPELMLSGGADNHLKIFHHSNTSPT
ncbi:hypothetical protein BaRGS_00015550 [Batillaria attramentaria]|uniref:Ribosome biogenesis protein WDR12 homolog n=1 Tax=Batillaria attramentaria TaxID=370345 RepID=A0ABD0L1L5_9CAEN